MKSTGRILFIISLLLMFGINAAMAMRLATVEQAVRATMPDATSLQSMVVQLSPADKAKIAAMTGNQDYQYEDSYKVVIGKDGSKKMGAAIPISHMGRWGIIEYLVTLAPDAPKVLDVTVLSYEEKKGRPIARRAFLDQFVGKTLSDPIALKKDIDQVAEATISSRTSCMVIRAALAIYELKVFNK